MHGWGERRPTYVASATAGDGWLISELDSHIDFGAELDRALLECAGE